MVSSIHPYSEATADYLQPTKPRKQACLACRRRKKRCDGNQPACSACSAWNVDCVYASSSQNVFDYNFPAPNSPLGIDLAAFVHNLPLTPLDFPPPLSPLPLNTNQLVSEDGGPSPDSLTLVDTSYPSSRNLSADPTTPAPSPEQTIQLENEFFARFHPLLPSIHKQSFQSRPRGPQGPLLSRPLEWAILATAARTHRDVAVSSQANVFLQIAVDSLTQSPLLQENVLKNLQAAVWCVFSLYNSGEIAKSVVLLAQAYSLACLNGLNRLDDPSPNIPPTAQFSALESEECRCTLWALFVLDRHINFLMGRHFVIDDTLWCVNYPLDDRSLQYGLRPESERYDRDLAALASEMPNLSIGTSLTRFVCKASVILGRTVKYKTIDPIPTHAGGARNRLADFHELQSALACFWVSLPPYVHNISEVPPENTLQSVWLLIILHTCSTVLFYITEAERRSPGDTNMPTQQQNFQCSYKSVDKVVATLRQISGLATDAVSNPMLASSYFLCCRFILVQWRLSQQQSYRLDLSLVSKVLERMAQGQTHLPRMYKNVIDQELERNQQEGGVLHSLLPTEYCFLI
ncbi:hypothetical protein BO78DRAFT_392184 [Aspergillus sclerotiicarbonarius CBS 121057]|uniref:Zn(2)-C6 fungal-type domain-containing protein n=1 Tax=Aspergillus sclerotiicarbonarius (strain CBS 121057 / IBT 28362) TaxID=1448318 RepID=A0A319ESF6_ASPSB|nr:hypothetical protein BO78DRAFT_392184 [Aspergillus sclerotiicarbonarius CBS 121057]